MSSNNVYHELINSVNLIIHWMDGPRYFWGWVPRLYFHDVDPKINL
jgi:hypothetical protein